MNEGEVFIVEIPDSYYDYLIKDIIKYSIISSPFTTDRMNQIKRNGVVQGTKNRVSNIFKGKLAENLFHFFCDQNNLNVDFASCETPFYKIDNRDFLYNGTEYDIKNNFIYHPGDIYPDYTNLPALIPNKYKGDQWDSRLWPHHKNLNVGYIFSFLKGADLIEGKRCNDFYTLNLSPDQGSFLHDLYIQYEGLPQSNQPFTEDWFWNEMASRGSLAFFTLSFRPKLVITGVGHSTNWDTFRDTGPYSELNYKDHPIRNWYEKVGRKNSVKFLNGEIWGTITNKTSPISLLPSIKNVFGELNTHIRYGRFKS